MKGWGAPNPCLFASREGLGPPTLVHLQVGVVKGWAPPLVHLQIGVGGPPTLVYLDVGPNPCPFGSRPQVVKGGA